MRFFVAFCFFVSLSVCMESWGREEQFGYNGPNGDVGLRGVSGLNADNAVLFMGIMDGGMTHNFLLTGGDARPGLSGLPGANAYSCRQPSDVPYDLLGASGGIGGRGGDGGQGGNGGDLRIYTESLELLRYVLVDQSPGLGAVGGFGGQGGLGCQCTYRTWSMEVCNGNRCGFRQHSCTDGAYGTPGVRGRDGQNGKWGEIEVIVSDVVNKRTGLAPEQPQQTISLGSWAESSVLVSKHSWSKRPTLGIFAEGSHVLPEYSLWGGLTEHVVSLKWEETQFSISDLANMEVIISFGTPQFPKDVMVDMLEEKTTSDDGRILRTITVQNVTLLL